MSLAHLPPDICDRLLLSIGDLAALRSATLATKRLYEAFRMRKRSIIQAVEFNEVGPALPYALALVHIIMKHENMDFKYILEGINDMDSEGSYWYADGSVAEAYQLQKVSGVVKRLESHFSCFYKDRIASLSVLTDEESFRFHRAMYRAWILKALSQRAKSIPLTEQLVLNFIASVSDEELLQLNKAHVFLKILFDCVCAKDFDRNRAPQLPFSLDISWVLIYFDDEAFGIEGYSTSQFSENTAVAMAYDHLSNREVPYGTRAILDSEWVQNSHICQKCGWRSNLLYGVENWHWLKGSLSCHDLVQYLPGRLGNNNLIVQEFFKLMAPANFYANFLNNLFDGQNDPESGWNKLDWFCKDCIKDFIREHIFSWFVGRLVEDNYTFKDNCWYGWNCRTQTHSPHHAGRLNHVCPPTDKDDTGMSIAF